MKRALVALAIAGTAFALAAPASAEVCPLKFTGRPIVCVDPSEIVDL